MDLFHLLTVLCFCVLLTFSLFIIFISIIVGMMYPIPVNKGNGGGGGDDGPQNAGNGGGLVDGNVTDFLEAAKLGNLLRVLTLLNQDPYRENPRKLLESHDADGRTALSCSAHSGQIGVVRHLLQRFSFALIIQDKDRDRSYPIHQAYNGGHFETLQEFCTFCSGNNLTGAIFKQNKLGRTILHLAAREGNAGVVGYLTNLPGAVCYINVRDTGNRTALDLARQTEVKNLLQSASSSGGV